MGSIAQFQAQLASLSRDLGISELALDHNGECSLTFDDRTAITFYFDAEASHASIYATVSSLPEEIPQDLLVLMLQTNLSLSEMRGAIIGLDAECESAVVYRTLELAALDGPAFRQAVEDFVDVAEQWATVIHDMLAAEELFDEEAAAFEQPRLRV